MQTVREIQAKTVDYFTGKGVPNAKLDTDLLIAEVLGIKRLEIYLDIDRPLTETQLDALRPMVRRRAQREPLQYVLGYTEFCGMRFEVGPSVLIPRQETEELIELIRDRTVKPPATILDLGTGSGAIAIALSQVFSDAKIIATDQSVEALEVARRNAEAHAPSHKIEFRQGNWFDCIAAGEKFDLIVSNPPYLTEAEMDTAEPEVVKFEPGSALLSGQDGLTDLREIVAGAVHHLNPDGVIAFETGIDQHSDLERMAKDVGFESESVCDMSDRPRFFFAK